MSQSKTYKTWLIKEKNKIYKQMIQLMKKLDAYIVLNTAFAKFKMFMNKCRIF